MGEYKSGLGPDYHKRRWAEIEARRAAEAQREQERLREWSEEADKPYQGQPRREWIGPKPSGPVG